jgi:lysophospholipid acyltransferase (LPLAT)-like uncharacterized protein
MTLAGGVAGVARRGMDLLAASWRTEVVGREPVDRLRDRRQPLLYTVWHGHLLAALIQHRGDGTTLLVSGHRDGGHLARAARAWGFGAVRGSSTRGGVGGLRGLIRALARGGQAAVTPDGPRGPARMVKPGVIAAAQHTGATIIPIGTGASRAWRARSWDRFLVPGPFSRVRVVYGEPIEVAPGPEAAAAALRRLEATLNQVTREAECHG